MNLSARSSMRNARVAAVLTWVHAAGCGLPTVPVAAYLLEHRKLPVFLGLFEAYGGPWSSQLDHATFVVLLIGFLTVSLLAAWGARLVWKGSKRGAVLSLALLPVEAVFWLGFALPLPWVSGIARALLVARAWKAFG